MKIYRKTCFSKVPKMYRYPKRGRIVEEKKQSYLNPLALISKIIDAAIRLQKLTVLPRRNAAPAPTVAPTESAKRPTGKPKR